MVNCLNLFENIYISNTIEDKGDYLLIYLKNKQRGKFHIHKKKENECIP
jgi:hypothetical protein